MKFIFVFYVYLLLFPGLNGGGIERYRNHNYLFSWKSSDPRVANAKWDWFNARNYCRKRCMDLVSFETQDEYEWVKQRMSGEYGSFLLLPIFYCQIFAIYNLLKWFKSTLLRNTYLAKSEENLLQFSFLNTFFTSSYCVIFPICRTNFCGYINLLKKDYSIMKPFKKLGYLIIYLCT